MDQQTAMLREQAINVGVGMVSRSLEMVEWKVEEKFSYKPDSLYYKLNVKPNKNQNASEFWSDIIYKLFYNGGEALIIVTDDNDLLIADDFDVEEYAFYDNIFKNVSIGSFTYERSFTADEVIFLEYEQKDLSKLVGQLDNTYGELFNRILNVAMMTGQVRAKVKITGAMSKSENARKAIQNYIDKLYGAFRNNAIAIVPEMDGMEYAENSSDSRNVSRIDEVSNASNKYLDATLQAIGIHPSLVYGETSKTDIEFYQERYIINVIKPLAQLIEREFNAKFFSESEYLSGSRVVANTLKLEYTNIFSLAPAMEKAIGAKAMTPNEVREAAGLERVENPEMDEFYITKNIEGTSKGGDDDKQETNSSNEETSNSNET